MKMFIGIILFWLSIFGYLVFFKKKTKLPYELLLPIIFSILGIIMFLAGILNIMNEATILICLAGTAIFIYQLIKKRLKFKDLLNINFIIFLVVFIYISIIGSKMQILHYDNFSHWGLIIKNMFLDSSLPNFENAVIEFKNYQPGSACFIYYFGALTGKTEGSMIIAQNYLLISYFFSLFAFTKPDKKTKEKKNYILKILLLTFYSFMLFGNIKFNDLLVDTLIANMSICSFAIMYYFKDNLKKAFIYNLPILIFLFLIKNTGIVLVCFSCLGLVFLGFKNKEIKKGFLYAILTGIITIAFFYIWSKHVSYVYGSTGLSSKHSLSTSNIINQLSSKGTANILEFCKIYFNHFIDIFNNLPNKYMIGINIAIILMLIFYKKYRKHFTTCLIMSNVIYFMYYLILGIMYLFSMPWEEAICLASFDRYMLTIIFIIIGLVLIFFINAVIKENSISKQSIIISSCLIVTILFINFKYYISNYKLLIGDLDYETSTAYKFDKILETRYFNATDNNYYYIYAPKTSSGDLGYVHYVSKYKLNTNNIKVINNVSQIETEIDDTFKKNIIVIDEEDVIYKYIHENNYEKQGKIYIQKEDKKRSK